MTYSQQFATRWADNDVYGHLNNTIYYAAMDTTINTWLIGDAGFNPITSDPIAYCVTPSCTWVASGAFPDTLRVELGVGRMGTSSITWKLAILRDADDTLLANGEFVHVFVDRANRRPVSIPDELRAQIAAQLTA